MISCRDIHPGDIVEIGSWQNNGWEKLEVIIVAKNYFIASDNCKYSYITIKKIL